MEITYSLERDDYWQYNRFALRRTPALRRQALMRPLLLPAIIALDFWLFHLSLFWFVVGLPIITALWITYLFVFLRRAVGKQAERRVGSLGLHTMRLSPEGVREQNSTLELIVRWDKLVDIADGPTLVALFMGPGYALFVPKRVFAGPVQVQEFLATARAYWRSARDGTALILPEGQSIWPPAPKTLA